MSLGSPFGALEDIEMSSKIRRLFDSPGDPRISGNKPSGWWKSLSRVAVNNQQPGYKAVRYKLQGCKLSNLRISEDAHVSSNITEHYKAVKL